MNGIIEGIRWLCQDGDDGELGWRAFVGAFSLSGLDLISDCWPAGCRRYPAGIRSCSRTLEKAEMIGIFCLQRADQDVEGGELTQILEEGVAKKKGPAGEAGADTSLKPFEGGVAAFEERKDTGELIVAVVGVAERFGYGASSGEAIQGAIRFSGQGEMKAMETGEEGFFREQLERFLEQVFCFFQLAGHHCQMGSKVEGIFVAGILGKPSVDFVAGEIKFAIP
jgi:hypothetical protein